MAARTPLAAALDDIEAPSRLTDAEEQRRLRAAVDRAMDEALELVEEANLRGEARVTPATRSTLISTLSEAVGRIPEGVARATKPTVLHAALLDWHEELLDSLMPHRRGAPSVPVAEPLEWTLVVDDAGAWPDDQLGDGAGDSDVDDLAAS